MAGRLEPLGGGGGGRAASLAPLEPLGGAGGGGGGRLPPPRRASAASSLQSEQGAGSQSGPNEASLAAYAAAGEHPEMIESDEEGAEEPQRTRGHQGARGPPPAAAEERVPESSEGDGRSDEEAEEGRQGVEEERRHSSNGGRRRSGGAEHGPEEEEPEEEEYPPSPEHHHQQQQQQQQEHQHQQGSGMMVAEVDLAAAMRRVKGAFQRDTMQYMRSLGPLEWHARPSLLQKRFKEGNNTMEETLRPWLQDDGLYLARFHVDENDGIIPEPDTPQFKIEIGALKGVPKKVVPDREDPPQLRLVRSALFDRATKTFHGNIHTVLCNKTSDKGATWQFHKYQRIICRSFLQSPDLHVYLEFNVSHALTRKEAEQLPPTHKRAAEQVDETTVAWVLAPFHPSVGLTKPQTMTLPLMCGPLLQGEELSSLQEEAHKKKGFLTKMTTRKVRPQVTLKIVPVAEDEARHENYSLLPENVVTDVHTAMMISCYRTVLAAQLARVPTYMSTVCDPVVVAFPGLVDDPHMRVMLHRAWDQHVQPLEGVRLQEMEVLVRIFRQVVTMLWPVLHSQAVPVSSIMNFNVHQAARMRKLNEFSATHPVVSLSHSAYHWLHKPFDVQEVAYSYGDRLGPSI